MPTARRHCPGAKWSVSVITTFLPSRAGGSAYHRLGGGASPGGPIPTWSSKPGEIQSAELLNSGSLTLLWSGTGYCIVIPTGCRSYRCCASYCLTKSITQYCHCVESPTGVGMEDPSGS